MAGGASKVLPDVSASQYAALPWRRAGGRLEILLITTLSTKRWVVPKGWPVEGCTPSECAAQEALEEAGVVGVPTPQAIGSFSYLKRRKTGETVPCEVAVFALEVERQRRTWPEKAVRETCWCLVDEAVERVSDPGLKRVIARFARKQAQEPH